MYVQWGWEPWVRQYELYRGDSPDFDCDDQHHIASVVREAPFGVPYLVGRYEDHGLQPHTRYWYRLGVIPLMGKKPTQWTEPFSAVTRQKR